MTELKKYQYATIILSILVLILAIMLINGSNTSVDESLDEVKSGLVQCNDDIREWRTTNTTTPISADSQEELSQILEECASNLD